MSGRACNTARTASAVRRKRKAPPRFPTARSTSNGIGRLTESLVLAAETPTTRRRGPRDDQDVRRRKTSRPIEGAKSVTFLRSHPTTHERRDPLHRRPGTGSTTSGRRPVVRIVQAPIVYVCADPFHRRELGREVVVGITP